MIPILVSAFTVLSSASIDANLPPNRFPANPPLKHSIFDPIPNAISSRYTDKITKVIRSWPPSELPTDPKEITPIWMRSVHNAEDDIHIGIIKRMWVNAPLNRLAEVVENLSDYYSIFPSLIEVKVTRVDGNLVETKWEHRAPLFFLPNAAYEQTYIIDKSNPKRFVYRYQLIRANVIEHVDGVFVLEAVDDQHSMLSGYDFFMPAMGPLKIFGSGKVWKDGTEGSFKGDISIKLKAEHPDWNAERVRKESEAMLDKFPLDPLPPIEKGMFAPTPPKTKP